jgi:hypothetical protein
MNKLLIAALVSLSFSGAIAQEATYDYPSPVAVGKSRADVQAELAQSRLDGSYFAGGEHGGAARSFLPSRSRADVVAELNDARVEGTVFAGGEASFAPLARSATAATTVADSSDAMTRVEIVAVSRLVRDAAFVGGEATPDVPQRLPSHVSRGDVLAALERSHADGSYFAGGQANIDNGGTFRSTLTRTEVNEAVARSHADGTYWSGGETSPMYVTHEALQTHAASLIAQAQPTR